MREVLNFIKYSEDEEKLRQILQEVVDMCKALADMISRERKLGYDSGIEEGREAGREEERKKRIQIIKNMLNRGFAYEDIMDIAECGRDEIIQIQQTM